VGSVGRLFHVIGMVLAAYSVQWERGGKTSLASLLHGGRFVLSAEQRAKRIIKVTREADITLCKGFWNLSEEGLYYVSPSAKLLVFCLEITLIVRRFKIDSGRVSDTDPPHKTKMVPDRNCRQCSARRWP